MSIDFTQILNYGVLGIVVLAMLFGYLWAKPAVDELKERATKAEKQRDDALEAQKVFLPVLQNFNASVEILIPIIQRIAMNPQAYIDDGDDDPPPPRRRRPR